MLYFRSDLFGITPVKNTAVGRQEITEPTYFLFCDITHNVSYELYFDFTKAEKSIRRIYIDNSIYNISGLGGLKSAAENNGKKYNSVFAVTDTQLAGIIDYVGGADCFVTEELAELLGGIDKGAQPLAGIVATNIFGYEKSHELLCLELATDLFEKWCSELHKEEAFFKLLDLSDNDVSFISYKTICNNFSKFAEQSGY